MKLKIVLMMLLFSTTSLLAQDDWFDYDWDSFWVIQKPFISISAGISNNSHFNLNTDFAKTGSIEGRIGYLNSSSVFSNSPVESESFVFLRREAFDLGTEAKLNEFQTSAWKVGLGNTNGIPYKTGSVSILPYHGSMLQWAFMKMDTLNLVGPLREFADLYTDGVKCGNRFEGGVKFRFSDQVELGVGFERSVLYPRVKFWHWAGSMLVEGIGQNLVDKFVMKVFRSSPKTAPIVYFLLKNALSYGMYELRKEKMNWPFGSEAPFFSDTYKVNFSFIF